MAYNKIEDISKILNEYKETLEDRITDVIDSVAEEGKSKLVNETSTYTVRTGKYNKGWKVRKNKANRFVGRTIYNQKYYRLTHLLENGHITRNGSTRTRAFKHIEPVEKYCVDKYVKEVENIVKKGGK